MSKHITEWLSAYLDGELHGNRLHHVEAHLAECDACQTELTALEGLSGLLQEVALPEFTPPERLAAQISLRLPRQKTATPGKKILEIGWWMIPVGLLMIWIFMNTSFLVNDILSTANRLGLLTGMSDWALIGAPSTAAWSSTLGQIGVLSGNSLDLAASTETFTRTSLPQISLQLSIALGYLSWIAIWWTRHTRSQRQQHGQLLEG
jgi:predicted anti-sigma-YlaC factor YlaD